MQSRKEPEKQQQCYNTSKAQQQFQCRRKSPSNAARFYEFFQGFSLPTTESIAAWPLGHLAAPAPTRNLNYSRYEHKMNTWWQSKEKTCLTILLKATLKGCVTTLISSSCSVSARNLLSSQNVSFIPSYLAATVSTSTSRKLSFSQSSRAMWTFHVNFVSFVVLLRRPPQEGESAAIERWFHVAPPSSPPRSMEEDATFV